MDRAFGEIFFAIQQKNIKNIKKFNPSLNFYYKEYKEKNI